MRSPILRNKIVSKTIILALIMAIVIPPTAFAETQEECLARKAAAIRAAQVQIIHAKLQVAIAAVNLAVAAWKLAVAYLNWKDGPWWDVPGNISRLAKLVAANKAYKKASANYKAAQNYLNSAYAALAAALAIECPPDCE